MTNLTRYSFVVDYFDPHANLTRSYQFFYYIEDDTIEMYDLKTRRMFLKRCAYPSLNVKELFVGATINVFSRPLKVVDYGDEVTRNCFSKDAAEIMVTVSESGMLQAGNIVSALTERELRISNIRLVDLPQSLATRANTTKRCMVIVVNGAKAGEKVAAVNAAFDGALGVVDGEGDIKAIHEAALGAGSTTARLRDCAVCVIKPHAITSGQQGAILQRLLDEGFIVTALGQYTMTTADAEDFLEVYNGVVPEYKKLIEQMSSGPCWAVEVCAENAVAALRAVCGPHDPEVCHVLFPHTLRSQFGVDRTRNCVHCTDLEEDGPLESEFFFSLMQNKV